jgi:hypothetical protein
MSSNAIGGEPDSRVPLFNVRRNEGTVDQKGRLPGVAWDKAFQNSIPILDAPDTFHLESTKNTRLASPARIVQFTESEFQNNFGEDAAIGVLYVHDAALHNHLNAE